MDAQGLPMEIRVALRLMGDDTAARQQMLDAVWQELDRRAMPMSSAGAPVLFRNMTADALYRLVDLLTATGGVDWRYRRR